MTEESASMYFTKWRLSKVTNCPNNILAAATGGLIIRKHSLKTLASALRLFPYPCTAAGTAEQSMLAEGAVASAHHYHLLQQHKVTKKCVAAAAPLDFERDTRLFSSPRSYNVDRCCRMTEGCPHLPITNRLPAQDSGSPRTQLQRSRALA